MGDENFNLESFIKFMKLLKISRGSFESLIEILNSNYLSKIRVV